MKQMLEPLRTSDLTNMEGGQLMKRHLNDLRSIQPELLTDLPFNSYLQKLTENADLYEKALAQVRKNEKTEKISLADNVRDGAVDAFKKALKLYAVSDDPSEVEASRGLRILVDSCKNLAGLNYEAETMAIDKLVGELALPNYVTKVGILQMERYVVRLASANETFKTLFSGRMVTSAMAEVHELKSIRKETFKWYSEFCNYVLAMAKAVNIPLFSTSLDLLNNARKYYADLLARRTVPLTETINAAV
jgi:hypothetical protein